MNKIFKNFFFFCAFVFSGIVCSQQENPQPISLLNALTLLENKFGVSFSYADESIQDKFLQRPNESNSLPQILEEIGKRLNLEFTILNDRFITIKNKSKIIIPHEALEEVLVNGYLTKGIRKKTNGSITINANELGILPGLIEPDVLQTLKALPGVVSTDESISNLNIRGGTSDQNLLLFDGVRMYMSGHFFGLISAFNPYLQHEVTVTKSGTHPKYGEGVSSTVVIELPHKILDNDLKVSAAVNLLNLNLISKIPLTKNAELQLAARRAITDFVGTPTYDKYFERAFQDSDLESIKNSNSIISKDEEFRFYDIYGKLLWDISKKDKLSVFLLNIDNSLTYEESLLNGIKDQDFTSELNQKNITSGISYKRKWNKNFSTEAHAYYTNYQLFSNNADIVNEQNLKQENQVEDNGFKLAGAYQFNADTALDLGYQFSQMAAGNLEDIDNPFFRRYIKHVVITHGLYSDFNYKFHKVTLHAGLRANYFDKLRRIRVEPRLAFNYKLSDAVRFEVTGDLKSQVISQIIDLQNDFLGIEKRRWMLANGVDIPLVTGQQIASGLYFKKNGFLVSVEGYLKKVAGINSRSQGFQNQFQFVKDIGSYRVNGLDFLIQKKLRNLRFWASYSYLKNDYLFENLNNSNIFPNNVDIRNIVNFSGTYTRKNFDFGLGLNWHSGNPFTEIIGLNESSTAIDFQEPNASRIEQFFRLDSSLKYGFKMGATDAKLGVSVWNLFNNENVLNTYYDLDNGIISKIDNTSLGITPNFTFKIDF